MDIVFKIMSCLFFSCKPPNLREIVLKIPKDIWLMIINLLDINDVANMKFLYIPKLLRALKQLNDQDKTFAKILRNPMHYTFYYNVFTGPPNGNTLEDIMTRSYCYGNIPLFKYCCSDPASQYILHYWKINNKEFHSLIRKFQKIAENSDFDWEKVLIETCNSGDFKLMNFVIERIRRSSIHGVRLDSVLIDAMRKDKKRLFVYLFKQCKKDIARLVCNDAMLLSTGSPVCARLFVNHSKIV